MLSTMLVVLLSFLFVSSVPTWPYNKRWGYRTAGVVGGSLMVAFASVMAVSA